jgi:hypothetical protein
MDKEPLRKPGHKAGFLAVLVLAVVVAGCGRSLDELLNQSQVNSVGATPNPVPDPGAGRETSFTLTANIDSNNDDDYLFVYARNPDDRDRWVLIGFTEACVGGGDNCGLRSREITCWSRDDTRRSGRRVLDCGESAVSLPVGNHVVRTEIDQCYAADPRRCSGAYDDSAEFTLTLR